MIRLITFAWGPYTWLIKPCVEALHHQWRGSFFSNLTVMTDNVNADMPSMDLFRSREMFILNPGWRPDNFSNRLADMLGTLTDDVFFWTTPDTFWLDSISAHDIMALVEFMMYRRDIVRVTLHHIPALDDNRHHAAKVNGLDLVTCSDTRHCSLVNGIAMGPGLIRRKLLLELLEPGWNLWDVEQRGTEKMMRHYPWLTSLAVYPGLRKLDVCHRGHIRDLSPLPEWMSGMIQEAKGGH